MKISLVQYFTSAFVLVGIVGCGGSSDTPPNNATITAYTVEPSSVIPSSPVPFADSVLSDQRIVNDHAYRVGNLSGSIYSWVDSTQSNLSVPVSDSNLTNWVPIYTGPSGTWWSFFDMTSSNPYGNIFQPNSGDLIRKDGFFGVVVSHDAGILFGGTVGGATALTTTGATTLFPGPDGQAVNTWSINSAMQGTGSTSMMTVPNHVRPLRQVPGPVDASKAALTATADPFYLLTVAGATALSGTNLGISENGTIFGADGQTPAYWSGGTAVHLPLPSGFQSGYVLSASPNAEFLIGEVFEGTFTSFTNVKYVVWQVDGSNSKALDVAALASFDGTFSPWDVTDEGKVIGYLIGTDGKWQSAVLDPVWANQG